MNRAIVTGAGGFIGYHLTCYLKERGYYVRGVDLKRPEFAPTEADEFLIRDLRYPLPAQDAISGGFDELYALAADMGGMGFISNHDAQIMRNNTRINLNTIEAALRGKIQRYFFASSACIYPEYRQVDIDSPALSEDMAWPAQPQDAYGLEKLYTEELLQHCQAAYGLIVRIARFHNVYGPLGTWTGGREKAPAAICRKIAEAKVCAEKSGEPTYTNPVTGVTFRGTADGLLPFPIEIWGDGEQTRSFLYIDDCLEGIYRLMHSHYNAPMNIGSETAVSINDLVYLVARLAGIDVGIVPVEGPQGVRGRNSDNTLSRAVLDWKPARSLDGGMEILYLWIEDQVRETIHHDQEVGFNAHTEEAQDNEA